MSNGRVLIPIGFKWMQNGFKAPSIDIRWKPFYSGLKPFYIGIKSFYPKVASFCLETKPFYSGAVSGRDF